MLVTDFSPIDVSVEERTLGFQFTLPSGVTLTGTPELQISAKFGNDQSPASRIIGPPFLANDSTTVGFKIGNCVAPEKYLLWASCARSDGDVASAWSHITCNAPT